MVIFCRVGFDVFLGDCNDENRVWLWWFLVYVCGGNSLSIFFFFYDFVDFLYVGNVDFEEIFYVYIMVFFFVDG